MLYLHNNDYSLSLLYRKLQKIMKLTDSFTQEELRELNILNTEKCQIHQEQAILYYENGGFHLEYCCCVEFATHLHTKIAERIAIQKKDYF